MLICVSPSPLRHWKELIRRLCNLSWFQTPCGFFWRQRMPFKTSLQLVWFQLILWVRVSLSANPLMFSCFSEGSQLQEWLFPRCLLLLFESEMLGANKVSFTHRGTERPAAGHECWLPVSGGNGRLSDLATYPSLPPACYLWRLQNIIKTGPTCSWSRGRILVW